MSFKAAWWLPNASLQSIYSSVMPLWRRLKFRVLECVLPDGDVVEYALVGQLQQRWVLLLSGLQGSCQSPVVQHAAQALLQAGYAVVVMHYRSCGTGINRMAKAYNACDTHDLHALLQHLAHEHQIQLSYAIGFSIGGNLLTHYLRRKDHMPLAGAITVSTPFELVSAVANMTRRQHHFMLRLLKPKILEKIKQGISMPLSARQMKKVRTMQEFDNLYTAPVGGFADADAYYRYASCRPLLANIKTPLHMVYAQDDPLIPASTIPALRACSHYVCLEAQRQGGHLGFITGAVPFYARYWLPQRLVAVLGGFGATA